jgi:hypothetical protein
MIAALVFSLSLSPPPEIFKPRPADSMLVLKRGTGSLRPAESDVVRAHYVVFEPDHKTVRDYKIYPDQILVRVSDMFPDWKNCVSKMTAGEVRACWMDEDVVVMTELIDVYRPPETPPAQPPADAITLPSGAMLKVLKAGPAGKHPAPTDTVRVDFVVWKSDGTLFDAATLHGGPGSFAMATLTGVWGEVLQRMVAGERTRVWMPAELAFGNDPSKPTGTVVYELELQSIVPTAVAGPVAAPRSLREPPKVNLKPPIPKRP